MVASKHTHFLLFLFPFMRSINDDLQDKARRKKVHVRGQVYVYLASTHSYISIAT